MKIDTIIINGEKAVRPAVPLNTNVLPEGLFKRRRIPFGNIPTFEDKSGQKKGLYGQPVYWDVAFMDEASNEQINLPIPPLITVTLSKRIVETPVNGRSGTVKEIISSEDYAVLFQGIARRPDEELNEAYPDEELERILQIFRPNTQLRVYCDYLAYFGITHIVVKEVSFPVKEGFQETVFFELKTLSDEPFELQLISDGI